MDLQDVLKKEIKKASLEEKEKAKSEFKHAKALAEARKHAAIQ